MEFGISIDVVDCQNAIPLISKYDHIINHIQIYLDDRPFDVIQHDIARLTSLLGARKSYSFLCIW